MPIHSDPTKMEEGELIYALDIGTRSVIGMLGALEQGRIRILALEKQPHARRAMLDGQIEDIDQVAGAVSLVTHRLEEASGRRLTCACVAAAGRALRTELGRSTLELSAPEALGHERIHQLEATAVANAEQALSTDGPEEQRFFLVGYTPTQFWLDHYPLTTLLGHTGQHLEAAVVATFLPSEVVDSLYAVMQKAGLEVASMTLEPIAALNAAIPADLRLLNLALVDIGAGTSDIAVCRDGSVVGYTMATVAGDEITEALMRACLVDFPTAEAMKLELGRSKSVSFTDILGLEQTLPAEELFSLLDGPIQALADEIAQRICQVNGGPPSAVFLAGGGSKLPTLCARVAAALGIDSKRAALAGGYFQSSAYSDTFALSDPEYTTPLGIAVSAGLGLISDSYQVLLNGSPAKLFRSGSLTVLELLMMNGYRYSDLIGRSGKNLLLRIDGRRNVFYGSPAIPAQLAINGAEAAPSALIHAGDRIHFTPAQPGKDCVMTAAELCTKLRCKAVQREGRLLEGHTVLQSGDCLERMDAPPAPSPLPAREAPAQASVPPQRHVFLNGQPLTLSPKPNGSPYRLLDLLERSGLDFQHLDRPVLTQINGVDSPFQQLLAEGDKIEIRYQPWRLLPLLLPPLLLSACGGKDVPPEQYSSNDTALPALTSTLSSENIQFSHKEGSEDQPDSYVYSGLSSMTDTLASYVQALEEDGCSPIDTNGVVKELPDFSVSMGKDTGDGGVFQLQIAWEGDTCTITPVYAAELRITQPSVQALTVSEAIQRLKSCTPALLGLSGASMEEYEVYAEEGLVLVDSSPCLQLNVYSSTPRQYRGCYLMTVDGAHLYQLDRDASQVTELTPYSNTAVK